MGGATVLVGLLPGYAQIGVLAPIILVTLRMLQGLALGGEYGGAAIYVAEHAREKKARPVHELDPQTTATIGLFLALAVILIFRLSMGMDRVFGDFGWRIPFLLVRCWCSRRSTSGSSCRRPRSTGAPRSRARRRDPAAGIAGHPEATGASSCWPCSALTAGQAVVWYTGQFDPCRT